MDGTDIRKEYTDKNNIFYPYDFTVINGVLYGVFVDYDEKKHDYNRTVYFGGVDLSTGRFITTKDSK